MDINIINKIVNETYNCMVINIFNYGNTDIIKGLETLQNGIKYRYFKIVNEEIIEILDEETLKYLIDKNEIHKDVNY